ncbi:hypothetical protein SCACP_31300 [Sporomusa carbonis]|uniref:nucleotide exchange factor GrpE n=1 Tax=Sporomusa carbonis TaxID=3076075 RepID=UPI003A6508F7
MSWLFWKKDRHREFEHAVGLLASQQQEIKDAINEISKRTAENLQQQDEFSGQLAKLTRLQYKSGQEVQAKLEQLAQGLKAVRQWQAEYDAKTDSFITVSRQREYLLDVLLCQLDEIDMACAGLNDKENNAWQPLLHQWAQRIVAALAELGIYEVDIIGKTFDPQVAIGVGVMPRAPGTAANIPYEVAEVVKRGFVDSEGRLLRKAQVITYQEVTG